jgi:hypothetical protein
MVGSRPLQVMGVQNVNENSGARELGLFMRHLLRDVHALERMLDMGMFESDLRRIGAEQELFLVGRDWQPAAVSLKVLEELKDPHFTTELAQFNLEFNLDPVVFGDDCLRRMERHNCPITWAKSAKPPRRWAARSS